MIKKALFLMEQYCDADPRCGPSGAEHQVVGAVMSTGLVKESKHFYFDQVSRRLGRNNMEVLLIEDCQAYQPELVIYTPLGGDLGTQLNPTHETMRKIMAMGHKVYLNLWDAPEHGLEGQWLPSADLLGVDSLVTNYRNYRHIPNVIFVHSTVDPREHYDKGLRRTTDVSFVGSLDPADQRWPLRTEYTRYLRDNGVQMVVVGGQRGQGRLTTEACAGILNQSKISLDFCRSSDGRPTMHLRAFEVMACGALLMEDRDTLSGELFDVGKDFLIFNSKEELLDLVRYYLSHEEERLAIARSGMKKVRDVFNAENMWGYVFERMGFELPKILRFSSDYTLHKSVIEGI